MWGAPLVSRRQKVPAANRRVRSSQTQEVCPRAGGSDTEYTETDPMSCPCPWSSRKAPEGQWVRTDTFKCFHHLKGRGSKDPRF